MMRLVIQLFALILLLTLGGCYKTPDVHGTWRGVVTRSELFDADGNAYPAVSLCITEGIRTPCVAQVGVFFKKDRSAYAPAELPVANGEFVEVTGTFEFITIKDPAGKRWVDLRPGVKTMIIVSGPDANPGSYLRLDGKIKKIPPSTD